LSGGERSRVLLGKILANPVNLLLLDEPTNHLDQESIEGLLQGLEVFEGAVLMVTHSEMILQRFAKRLIVFQNDEILVFEGTYDDFLRRVGWSTENTQENGDETQGRLSKKEIRQQRAKQLTQKSRVLKPLQTQVNKLEHQILKLEKEVNAATQHLIEASASNDVPKQVRLSKKLKQDETQIEILYSELDQVTREYESALAELDE
ncbi:MAG TPA: ABC transporter ATP-binding protein, partial [bacterium]|nr:ABC transporter ATP-binding protein [bacterium]